MCRSEKLPNLEYHSLVKEYIQDTGEPHDDVDIHHAAYNGLTLHSDPIEAETQEVGEIATLLNAGLGGVLVDGDRTLVQWEYEDIFHSYIARRADRPSQEPTEAARNMIKLWLDDVDSYQDPELEIGSLRAMPTPERIASSLTLRRILKVPFVPMIRTSLPKKLDHDSWIGEMARQKFQQKHGDIFGDGHFERVGHTGKLVWRWRRKVRIFTRLLRQADIRQFVEEMEDNLVRLSIQIANWLAFHITFEHVFPVARDASRKGLTDANLIEAVVEILGDEWFELPFDKQGKLKAWKWQRTMPLDPDRHRSIYLGEDAI